jgi:phosphoenolpyruvate carboxykinase (GTP)
VATPLETWVDQAAKLTKPARVVYCDGSEAEYQRMIAEMLRPGDSFTLNEKTYPNCHLHRSSPNDVARTEHLTFICTPEKEEAGPTNNWMDPDAAKHKVGALLDGAMRGRAMYVVPYVMGPVTSPISKIGVEVTDSPYVVASMRIMSRMGNVAIERMGASSEFVPGLHSLGDLDPLRRYIVHFPQEKLIWSVGSGYGGNALLGKKCFALRIASVMAREQGWMAEHMLILGLQSPGGKVTYMGAAFPSACGKTNLAMMVSALEDQGYRVWTVGDDIAWMKIGEDGYLHAINPEAGFFGVAPGTGMKTNQNVMGALHKNTLFTNVAMSPEREPWWEGIGSEAPAGLINWKGEPWDPSKGSRQAFLPSGKRRRAFRFRRSYLADGEREWRRWCMNRLIGSTVYSWARQWRAKRPPRRQATWASRAGTPWPCFPSAATTWPIILGTGWRWGRKYRSRQGFFT